MSGVNAFLSHGCILARELELTGDADRLIAAILEELYVSHSRQSSSPLGRYFDTC